MDLSPYKHVRVVEVTVTQGVQLSPHELNIDQDFASKPFTGVKDDEPAAILYLAELDESMKQSFQQHKWPIPDSFMNAHLNGCSTIIPNFHDDASTQAFHFTWITPAMQTKDQGTIAQRISVGKPYDIDTIRDPHDLRLDHTRFDTSPLPHRPYHPISVSDGGDSPIEHAAFECVSIYSTKINDVDVGKAEEPATGRVPDP
jgi:hypothetical protein